MFSFIQNRLYARILKLVFVVPVIALTNCVILAQSVSNYGFSRVAEGWYSSPGGTTQLIGANIDEQLSAATDIGFDFWYNGAKYTQFKASSNGFITLNTSLTSPSPANALSSAANQLIIAPLWDDLKTGTSGKVHYLLNAGDPANKQLIIEFYSMKWNASSSNDVITFKITLFHTSNRIEFWYGTGTGSVNSGSASIGLNGNASGAQQFLSVTPTNPPTKSTSVENSTISSRPPAYDHYTFTPHHAGNILNAPSNLVATGVSSSQINFSWTDNASNETAYVVYFSSQDPVILGGSTTMRLLPANTTSTSFTGLNMSSTYFIRVFALKEALSSTLGGSGTTQWNTPTCPTVSAPSNGTTGVCPSSISLNWANTGGSPTSYNLYFGTNNPPTNIVNGSNLGNVQTYNAGALSSNTTYYWRIAPSNAAGTTNSCNVWSFTTASAGGSYTWTGNNSTSWHTAANWSGCAVPGWNSDVIIPSATNAPVISSSAEAGDLTIQSGGSLTISSNILHLHGDFTNNGTFTDNGNTVMLIGGSSVQSISGTTTFHNLTVDNVFGVTLNGATTVNGILTLNRNTLTTNDNLTVNLNTGAIAGTGTGSLSGNVIFTKSVNSARYHYLSSPLNGTTVANWNDDVQIKTGSYSNLYYYNETVASPVETDGWTGISSLSTPVDPLKGYALFFEGARTIDVTGTYTHNAGFSNSSLTNTPSGSAGSDGWHLVGNPYPSALNWNAGGWTKTNIDNAIYFWDPSTDQYASYVNGTGTNGGTPYIPSMQGFWVKTNVSGGTGTLGVTNSARVTSVNPSIWKTGVLSNLLRLKVQSGVYKDETIIRFLSEANETFNSDWDAYKLKNEEKTPSLYTVLGDIDYSVNSLSDTLSAIDIPLHLQSGFAGEYVLTAEDAGSLFNFSTVLLEDKKLDSIHNFKLNPVYTFHSATDDASERFTLKFKNSGSAFNTNLVASSKIAIRSFDHAVHIEFKNTTETQSDISIYDLIGHKIAEVKNADISSGMYTLALPHETGIYIAKVTIKGELFTQKIFLK